MSKLITCTKCGQTNRVQDNAKDKVKCGRCGVPLKTSSLMDNPIIIFVFPVIWIILFVKLWSYTELKLAIVEGAGGAGVILLVSIIIIALIWGIKKFRGTSYPNFIKHTFIGTAIVFSIGVYTQVNKYNTKAISRQAYSAYENGQFYKAFELYSKACENNYASACGMLGSLYSTGTGVLQDDQQALHYNRKACDGGDKLSCFSVANDYYFKKDYSKAKIYYHQAAEENFAPAYTQLGYLHMNGLGVNKNEQKAVELYKKACNTGDAEGCRRLGTCYMDGYGVIPNNTIGIKMYKKACRGGDLGACVLLGYQYLIGETVQENLFDAKRYFKKACDGGDEEGCKKYRELNSRGY